MVFPVTESYLEDPMSSPGSLASICTNNIIKKIFSPITPSGPCDDLGTSCDWAIKVEVCKHYLKGLPFHLTENILDQAHKLLDNHHDIDKLLLLILSAIENCRTRRLKTPVYLYSSELGRIRLLESLIGSDILQNLKDVQFCMYNFYHRTDLGPSVWSDDEDMDFIMSRLRLNEKEDLLLKDVLTRCTNLVSITLHTVCTDSMINIISKTCEKLKVLDASFSKNITDDGMATLATSVPLQSTLTTVKLENTLVSKAGIFMLLDHVKSLMFIESSVMEHYLYCMQNFFNKSTVLDAALLRNSNSHFGIRKLFLSLTSYQEDKLSIFYVITILFPNLVELKIHTLHRNEFENLGCLANLTGLKSLMIGATPLKFLVPVFSKIGGNLTTFCYICYNDQTAARDHINFSVVSELCPNLQFLSISGSALVHDRISAGSLSALKNVMLNVHAFIPLQIWTHLLSNCSNLVHIDLTKCEGLTDDSLAATLHAAKDDVSHIEKFVIKGSHRQDVLLTDKSLRLLKTKCEKIREIGDCFTWSLSRKDYSVNQIRSLL